MSTAVIAIVDRGERQAIAVAFLVCMSAYGVVLLAQRRTRSGQDINYEMSTDENAKLPTTIPLQLMHGGLAQVWLIDEASVRFRLEELPTATTIRDSRLPRDLQERMGTQPLSTSTQAPKTVSWSGITPSPSHFMQIGHSLWALVFGYFGGHFGRCVYARRLREQGGDAAN